MGELYILHPLTICFTVDLDVVAVVISTGKRFTCCAVFIDYVKYSDRGQSVRAARGLGAKTPGAQERR
jgi:hypothetical protein